MAADFVKELFPANRRSFSALGIVWFYVNIVGVGLVLKLIKALWQYNAISVSSVKMEKQVDFDPRL